MKEHKEDKNTAKRPYRKPRLRTIELVAEEVLAVGCKTESGGGPMAGGTCILGNSCWGQGS